jgi:uncharacterized membrane protein YfcA
MAVFGAWFSYCLLRDFNAHRHQLENVSWIKTGIIGFIVNFFDTLGIGAFAPQTALLRATKQTEDKKMPGTLNVANTFSTLVQAAIYIKVITVDTLTLVVMLVMAVVGAVIGAGIVARMSVTRIRLIMGFALLVTAGFMFAKNMHWIAAYGNITALRGGTLVFAAVANFILGALMTVGIGLYAPCMALVYALGLPAIAAFPIMMGSCAFLMPPASVKFIKAGAYNRKAALGMAVPSIAAVLIAAFIVKSLNLTTVTWIVIGVVIYTGIMMVITGFKKRRTESGDVK